MDTNSNVSSYSELHVGWLTLVIVTLAIFIISIDISFLNVAISTLVKDLHTNIITIQKIIVVYALVMASLTLLCGELLKIMGRKKTFLIGTIIYGVGTIIATFSLNADMLFLGWSILEGIGGALMFVSTTSLIVGCYAGERRALALGVVSSVGSGAAVIGPFIGGILTTYFTWRYAFGLEFVIILVMLLFSRKIPSFPKSMKWSEIDIIGAIISGAGILLLVYGINLLNNPKNIHFSPYLITAGVILLLIFFLNQGNRLKNDKHPLVDIRIFKSLNFDLGNILRFLIGFVSGGLRFVIPVFVQTVLGFNALTTGAIFAAMAAPWFVITFTTGKVSKRVQPRYIVSVGFVIALIGSIYLTSSISAHTSLLEIVLGMAFIGLGAGIIFPHSSNFLFADISHDKQPDASAVMNTINNLTGSLGPAILGLILLGGAVSALSIENLVVGMVNTFYAIIIIILLGIIISQFVPAQKKDVH